MMIQADFNGARVFGIACSKDLQSGQKRFNLNPRNSATQES